MTQRHDSIICNPPYIWIFKYKLFLRLIIKTKKKAYGNIYNKIIHNIYAS